MYHVMKCLNRHMVWGRGRDLCAGRTVLMLLGHRWRMTAAQTGIDDWNKLVHFSLRWKKTHKRMLSYVSSLNTQGGKLNPVKLSRLKSITGTYRLAIIWT